MRLQDRKARDAAFALALEELQPERALMRAMVEARVRAGLTQAQLAQRMGTKQPVIARLEAGRRSPNIKTLRRLAAVTGSRLVVRLDEISS
jgi:ribosome-binding protein aMBF1 (putative translation factor)